MYIVSKDYVFTPIYAFFVKYFKNYKRPQIKDEEKLISILIPTTYVKI